MDTSGSPEQVAIRLADFLIGELYRDYDELGTMVEVFAPEPRKKLWRELAIYPAGVMHEIKDGLPVV